MRVLLFSGGVDSTCIALMLRPDLLVTVNYGQKCANGELRAASYLAKEIGIPHEILQADISHLGAGDLAGLPPAVGASVTDTWPLRNQFLITISTMHYAKHGLRELFVGTLSTDGEHPDGRPEFIKAISTLINIQEPNVLVVAPAIDMDVNLLVKKSGISRDLLGWTFSCHVSDIPCGACRGCNKTLELLDSLST